MTREKLTEEIARRIDSRPFVGRLTFGLLLDQTQRDLNRRRAVAINSAELMLSHPRIDRALALLDRIGDEAADALIVGTAAVVPVEATEGMCVAAYWAPERVAKADNTAELAMQRYGHAIREAIAAGRLDRGGA